MTSSIQTDANSRKGSSGSDLPTPPNTPDKPQHKGVTLQVRKAQKCVSFNLNEEQEDPTYVDQTTGATPQISQSTSQTPSPKSGTYPSALQEIQYRSYKYTISIYHYNTSLLPLATFQHRLKKRSLGWHHNRTGPDPTYDWKVPPGDETPEGLIEIIYIPDLYHNTGHGKGSIIAFRTDKDKLASALEGERKVEFFCFDRPVKSLLVNAVNDEGELICERVASQAKDGAPDGRGEKGNPEHKAWYRAAVGAQQVPDVSPQLLTWKTRAKDLAGAIKKGEELPTKVQWEPGVIGSLGRIHAGRGGNFC